MKEYTFRCPNCSYTGQPLRQEKGTSSTFVEALELEAESILPETLRYGESCFYSDPEGFLVYTCPGCLATVARSDEEMIEVLKQYGTTTER